MYPESEVDQDALTSNSDSDDAGTTHRVFDRLQPTGSHTLASNESLQDSQNVVNKQILTHLSLINDRQNLYKRMVRKSMINQRSKTRVLEVKVKPQKRKDQIQTSTQSFSRNEKCKL